MVSKQADVEYMDGFRGVNDGGMKQRAMAMEPRPPVAHSDGSSRVINESVCEGARE